MAKRNLSIFRTIGKNIKANATMTTFKKAGWAALGAATYALVPTAVQGWMKYDMSGWKGWGTGLMVGNLIGAMVNKPEMMMGATAAAGTHALYVKGNGAVNSVFGTPIFRFGSPALPAAEGEGSMSDRYLTALEDRYLTALNDGEKVLRMPDGSSVVAQTGPTPDEISTATPAIPAIAPALSDKALAFSDYEQMVNQGIFN